MPCVIARQVLGKRKLRYILLQRKEGKHGRRITRGQTNRTERYEAVCARKGMRSNLRSADWESALWGNASPGFRCSDDLDSLLMYLPRPRDWCRHRHLTHSVPYFRNKGAHFIKQHRNLKALLRLADLSCWNTTFRRYLLDLTPTSATEYHFRFLYFTDFIISLSV